MKGDGSGDCEGDMAGPPCRSRSGEGLALPPRLPDATSVESAGLRPLHIPHRGTLGPAPRA